ncbi:hypothetical protein [Clostridium beijerinckii]|uniref:Uncharacterized protein n=1 Tax=Clostridium beijerinckii TaxID=1520 RepID=A0A1S9N9L2_CLOBE|nr:hypothetical protein [Clostridium beijerinckii]OOP74155.1 hypothetical protein CBEIBR21_06555 [Clostridium beijerinckii]
MNNKIDRIINLFIKSINKEIKDNFKCIYEYDSEEDLFNIWHNYSDFNNIEFKKIIGKNIRKYFYNKDIYNISFAYNKNKTREIEIKKENEKVYGELLLQYIKVKPSPLAINFSRQFANQTYSFYLPSQFENVYNNKIPVNNDNLKSKSFYNNEKNTDIEQNINEILEVSVV